MLSHRVTWQQYRVETWVVDILQVGYLLPFEFPPPLSECPLHRSTYTQGLLKHLALQVEVKNMMEKGAVEVVKDPSPCFVQPCLYGSQSIGQLETGHRPVCSQLFHLAAIRKNNFKLTIDLKDALPDSSPPIIPEVSSLQSGRGSLSIHGPMLWSLNSPTSLLLSLNMGAHSRNLDPATPQRLAGSCGFLGKVDSTERNFSNFVTA